MNFKMYQKQVSHDLQEIADQLNHQNPSTLDELEYFISEKNLPVSTRIWDCAAFESLDEYLSCNADPDFLETIYEKDVPIAHLKHKFKLSDQPIYYSTVQVVIYPREEDALIAYMRQLKIDRIKELAAL